MKTQLTPGQATHMNIYRADSSLLLVVLVSLFTDGVSLTFNRHPVLDRQFTNLAEGRAYLRFLKAEAAAGTALWQIIERAGAWTTAATAVDQALIDSLNADLDAQPTPEPVEVRPANWNAFRQQARPVRNTRTQAFRKPPTAAMLLLMRQHQGGIVTTDGRASWLTLRAIVDKGLAHIHEVHGRHIIASVRLNAAGYAALETAGVAA
jgi:hypothetical protein